MAAPDAGDYTDDTATLSRLGASLVALRQRHDRLTMLFQSVFAALDDTPNAYDALTRLERVNRLLGRIEGRLAVVATTIAVLAERFGDGS